MTMPFSWEGTAFFLEAIAIGLFLYGWNRIVDRLTKSGFFSNDISAPFPVKSANHRFLLDS